MWPELDILIQRFETLKKDLPDMVGELIQENDALIEDLQTAQMDAGLDSDGNPIEPPYTPFTVQIKRMKGQPADRVTLKDTGDFHRAMKLTGGAGGAFAISNSDPKAAKLERKYGAEIFGLTEDSKQVIIDDVLRLELPERIRQKIEQ